MAETYGVPEGYRGFLKPKTWRSLYEEAVKDLHNQGGSILGSSRGGHDTNAGNRQHHADNNRNRSSAAANRKLNNHERNNGFAVALRVTNKESNGNKESNANKERNNGQFFYHRETKQLQQFFPVASTLPSNDLRIMGRQAIHPNWYNNKEKEKEATNVEQQQQQQRDVENENNNNLDNALSGSFPNQVMEESCWSFSANSSMHKEAPSAPSSSAYPPSHRYYDDEL